MPRNITTGNLALASFEDIFSTSGIIAMDGERIEQKLLTDLYSPDFHPFLVKDDLPMIRLAESIKQNGVREPGLARPRIQGGYELLCGNRRKRGCELAELESMPVIIRELDDATAAIIMVESNLHQREKILPSERASAYKVMMEALNHNGVESESHSYEIMVERTGVKKSQLFRIIRMTELIVPLIDKVDSNQLAFCPAVELSYLSVNEQAAVAEAMDANEIKPSLSQAKRLRELKKEEKLTLDAISTILSEAKRPPKGEPTGSTRFRKYFPPEYSQQQIEAVIVELLIAWKAKVAV
jgi:ParB family chromosome partitioning protein